MHTWTEFHQWSIHYLAVSEWTTHTHPLIGKLNMYAHEYMLNMDTYRCAQSCSTSTSDHLIDSQAQHGHAHAHPNRAWDGHTHVHTQSSISDHFNWKAQNGHMHVHTHTPRVPPKISSSVNRLRMDTLISNTVSQWSVYQLIGWEWTHSCTHTYMPQQSSPNDQFINWQAENRHTHAHIFTPSRVVSMISVSTDGLRMDTHTQTFTPKQSAPND